MSALHQVVPAGTRAENDPQLRISKRGDATCAGSGQRRSIILGPFDRRALRQYGLALASEASTCEEGAVVAIARKLAVLF